MEDSSEDKSGAYETIEFGGYTWRVLEKNEDSMLVITEEIIELGQYNEKDELVTWETCTLRNYLNNEFYNSFSASDHARIKETYVINDDNPSYGTSGGNNTTDNIFLLSIDEVNRYFSSDADRVALLSAEAANKYVDIYGTHNDWIMENVGKGWLWWLRSPGSYSNGAVDVRCGGGVNHHGSYVDGSSRGVRPALNLKY